MIYWALMAAAVLLSFERITYFWVSNYPARWLALCRQPALASFGGPVDVVHRLFYGFKLLQAGVFLGWCMLFADSLLPLPAATAVPLTLAAVLIAGGQWLNYSVFSQLGKTGVFYGRELGSEVPWVRGFPFSVLRHPQYIGAVLSIWGIFLIMRYPHDDWMILPLLETIYYLIGSHYEP